MKLYEVPKGSHVQLLETPTIPPVHTELRKDDILYFDHIDGMYSYCLDKNKQVVHLAAWTEVEIVK